MRADDSQHMYYPDLPCWCGGIPAFGVPHNRSVRYGQEGCCSFCGLRGNLGAELVIDGAGFRCENERRCIARADNKTLCQADRTNRDE